MTPCLLGDPHGSQTMVLYGDSHSAMWFQNIDVVAKAAHWKLWYIGKSACPAELLPTVNPKGFGPLLGSYRQCTQWHTFAIAKINQLRPDLVIVSQELEAAPGGVAYSSSQWQAGLTDFFSSITVPNVHFDVIGNIPTLSTDPPFCLDVHADDVPACSTPRAKAINFYNQAEADTVNSVGGRYVDVTPWFCSATCTAVIGNYQVYFDGYHVTGPYAATLEGVMAGALQLPPSTDTSWYLSTRVLTPAGGAVLRGTALLAAAVPASTGVHVQFVLTGNGYDQSVVATAQETFYGWIAHWNTTGVPNGTYILRSQAHSSNNGAGLSRGVAVRVAN